MSWRTRSSISRSSSSLACVAVRPETRSSSRTRRPRAACSSLLELRGVRLAVGDALLAPRRSRPRVCSTWSSRAPQALLALRELDAPLARARCSTSPAACGLRAPWPRSRPPCGCVCASRLRVLEQRSAAARRPSARPRRTSSAGANRPVRQRAAPATRDRDHETPITTSICASRAPHGAMREPARQCGAAGKRPRVQEPPRRRGAVTVRRERERHTMLEIAATPRFWRQMIRSCRILRSSRGHAPVVEVAAQTQRDARPRALLAKPPIARAAAARGATSSAGRRARAIPAAFATASRHARSGQVVLDRAAGPQPRASRRSASAAGVALVVDVADRAQIVEHPAATSGGAAARELRAQLVAARARAARAQSPARRIAPVALVAIALRLGGTPLDGLPSMRRARGRSPSPRRHLGGRRRSPCRARERRAGHATPSSPPGSLSRMRLQRCRDARLQERDGVRRGPGRAASRRSEKYEPDFCDDLVLDPDVEDAALPGDALAVDDVELGLPERRRHLVLDDLDADAVAVRVAAVLERLDAADVEADRRVELERAAARRESRASRT